MKKRFVGIVLAGMVCCSGLGLTACGGSTIPVSYDSQISADGTYNKNLFYRNDCEIYAPDSQVLKITEGEEAGYYYLYATNSLTVYRSKDMNNWENMSQIVGFNAYLPDKNDFGNGVTDSWWAPEVIYDSEAGENGMYYLYFSMEPRHGNPDLYDETLICAKSENPYGPFVSVRAPQAPVSDWNSPETYPEKLVKGNENYFFDMERLAPILREKYPERFGESYSYVAALDPHPFVDPATNDKYLYWVSEQCYLDTETTGTCTFVIKMQDWETPIYEADSVWQLTKTGYTTVNGTELCDCEIEGNGTNEGPYVYARKQADNSYKYYLTISANGWDSKTYSVIQAVGDSPIGPFTKLQQADGGTLIGTDNTLWDHISGPGHHSFVEENGEVYILYHQHMDVVVAGSRRAVSLDEIKFTKNGKGQEVMYANGPTRSSIQLLPSSVSGYKNIAPEAAVTSSDKQDATILNDGLVSLYSYIDYVKEFKTKKEVTLTFTFEDYREITGIMIYNSKEYSTAFDKIPSVKIHFKDGEKEYVGELKDIPFDMETNSFSAQFAMRPGAAAIALFHPSLINKIEVTVSVPDKRVIDQDDEGNYIYQQEVAFSEIKIIGKV